MDQRKTQAIDRGGKFNAREFLAGLNRQAKTFEDVVSTLKHHPQDVIASANKILKDIGAEPGHPVAISLPNKFKKVLDIFSTKSKDT